MYNAAYIKFWLRIDCVGYCTTIWALSAPIRKVMLHAYRLQYRKITVFLFQTILVGYIIILTQACLLGLDHLHAHSYPLVILYDSLGERLQLFQPG